VLEQGPFGFRAVLTSSWDERIQQSLLKIPITELELNLGKGWSGEDISFLKDFPELLVFKIFDLTMKSVSPIHAFA
jgi:hypothetical protein